MSGLSEDAIFRGLRDAGFPEAVARRRAREEAASVAREPLLREVVHREVVDRLAPYTTAAAEGWVWPLRFTLPWSHLCSDDKHYTATIVTVGDRQVAKIVRRQEYRDALARVRKLVGPLQQAAPVAFPLALVARVYVPDNRPGHDVPNFAKNCHDALEGIVYTLDQWLYSAHWRRVGVDIDRPRAEITITPDVPGGSR
jgi:hypothetical protein